MAKRTAVRKGKKREKKNINYGVAHIYSTFNNTILCISDKEGNVISWSSGGNVGYKGTRKSTPYAAQIVAQQVAAIRSLQAAGLQVNLIKDTTPIPHNGCRPPKRRRV